MQNNRNFHAVYRNLDERMKALAAADGDVFLPNPEPEGPVQYVLICMEPSLGRWAHSAEEARSKVEAGFRVTAQVPTRRQRKRRVALAQW